MDAVYILGSGSLADNLEILYSVRSLDYYMLDLRDIYVIGEEPKNLPGVFHIPATDPYKKRWKNAFYKTSKACRIDQLSDNFLFMNDDFFLTSFFYGRNFPYYALDGGRGGVDGPYYFGVHSPIVFNKKLYLEMPLSLKFQRQLSVRTFYANFYNVKPVFVKDNIIRPLDYQNDYARFCAGKNWVSMSSETILREDVQKFLSDLYPEPSRFEKK